MFDSSITFIRRLIKKKTDVSPVSTLPGGETKKDERRLWVRFSSDLDVTLHFADEHAMRRLSARIRDISQGGANLIVNQNFEAGQMVTIELPGQDLQRLALACVVHANPEQDGNWSLGCVFSRELNRSDLQSFDADLAKNQGDELRSWKRFSCKATGHFQIVGSDDTSCRPVEVLNISTSGVGLLIHEPVETGNLLNIDLQDASGKAVCSLLACVVHITRRNNGDIEAGCNFIRELNEDELAQLI